MGYSVPTVRCSDSDWYAVGWLFLGLGKLFEGLGGVGLWIVGAVALVITMAALLLVRKRNLVNAEDAETKEKTK